MYARLSTTYRYTACTLILLRLLSVKKFIERLRVAVIDHRLICDKKVNDHLLYSHSLCSCNNVNLLSHKSRANERRHERSRGGSHDQSGHALRTRRLRTRGAHPCLMYCKFDQYKLDQKKGNSRFYKKYLRTLWPDDTCTGAMGSLLQNAPWVLCCQRGASNIYYMYKTLTCTATYTVIRDSSLSSLACPLAMDTSTTPSISK